ncbi:MAG TPA: MarR family transcriptional regulator [Symbiobacteriaceae bacterium]|nr:MarR family transcriptional regulator [Symbiobacteriaceae bacterium]
MAIEKAAYVQLAQFRAALRSFLRFSEERARAAGLTPQQHQMLLAIKGQPERDWATPGEIALFLQVNHNAAVGLITRAETAGLVQRAPHPADGRKVAVSLTDRGEALLAELSTDHRAELERMAPTLLGLVALMDDGER